MDFAEWTKANKSQKSGSQTGKDKKEEEEKKKQQKQQNNNNYGAVGPLYEPVTSPVFVYNPNTSSKKNSTDNSFSTWTANSRANASAGTWAKESSRLVDDMSRYYSTWNKDSDERTKQFQSQLSAYIDASKKYKSSFSDQSRFNQFVSGLNDARDYARQSNAVYSQFSTKRDYDRAVQEANWEKKYANYTYGQKKSTIEQMKRNNPSATVDERKWLEQHIEDNMTSKDWDDYIADKQRELAAYEKTWNGKSDAVMSDPVTAANEWMAGRKAIQDDIERVKSKKYFAEKGEEYESLKTNPDFARYAKAPVTGDIRRKISTGGHLVQGEYVEDVKPEGDWKNEDWTQDEVDTATYIWNTQGEEAAKAYWNDYLKYKVLERAANRKQQEYAAYATKNFGTGALASLGSIGATLMSGTGLTSVAAQNLRNRIVGEEGYRPINYYGDAYDASRFSSATRGAISNKLDEKGTIQLDEKEHPFWSKILNGKGLGFIYQTGMSMADSAALAGITMGLAPALGEAAKFTTVLLGGSAGSQGVLDALDRGATDSQALWMGIFNGTFEALFEEVSLDHLIHPDKNFIINLLKQGFIEGSEEVSTSVMNNIADIAIMAANSDYRTKAQAYMDQGMSEDEALREALKDIAVDIGWDFVGGAISGGIMGGMSGARATIMRNASYVDAAKMYEAGDVVSGLQEVDPNNKLAARMQTKLTEDGDLSNWNKARMLNQTEQAIIQRDAANVRQAVVDRLTALGENVRDAGQVADAIVDIVSSQQLGEEAANKSKFRVRDSAYGQRVLNELTQATTGEYSSEWTQNINTEILGKANQDVYRFQRAISNYLNKNEENLAEEGYTVVRDENGRAVSLEANRELAEEAPADISELSSKYKGQAQTFVDNYEEGQSVEDYDAAFHDAYEMASSGLTMESVTKAMEGSILSESQLKAAYQAGREAADAVSARIANENRGKALRTNKKGWRRGSVSADGVTMADLDSALNDIATERGENVRDFVRKTINLMRTISEATGVDVVLYKSSADADRKYQGAQGRYEWKDSKIYVDINAGLMNVSDAKDIGKYIMLQTFTHEFVHFMEQWSPAEFNELRNLVFEQIAKSEDVDALIRDKQRRLGGNISYDQASKEVVADGLSRLLPQSSFVENLAREHQNVFQRLLERLKEFLADLKEHFAQLGKTNQREISYLTEDVDGQIQYVQDIVDLFDAVAQNAVENYQQTLEGTTETKLDPEKAFDNLTQKQTEQYIDAGLPVAPEAEVEWSIRTNTEQMDKTASFVDPERGKLLSDKVLEDVRVLREKVADYLQKNEKKLNLPNEVIGNPFVKNGSYDKSYDPTTICVRSLGVLRLQQLVSEKLGRPLTARENFEITQEAFEWTDNPQCLYCFAALDRMAKSEYLMDFINRQNRAVKALNDGAKKTDAYKAFLPDGHNGSTHMRKVFNGIYDRWKNNGRLLTLKDASTYEKLGKIINREDVGGIGELAYWAEQYAQNASWAKAQRQYQAYNGQILKWSPDEINTLNSHYGLRLNSHSEFSPAFILEYLQIYTDAAARGLKALEYTSDINAAKIFAPTGAAINMSISITGDTYDNMGMDAMQGCDWNEARAVRDQYENAGIVAVALNDVQTKWALDQDWIDVVIPMHLVKTGDEIAKYMNWTNTKAISDDKKKKGKWKGPKSGGTDQAHIYPSQHLNDKETYLRALEENNLTPRFEKWLDDPNYMKLVNETRQATTEMKPLQPVFDEDALWASLKMMEARGGYFERIGHSEEGEEYIVDEMTERFKKGPRYFQENPRGKVAADIFGEENVEYSRRIEDINTDYMVAVESGDEATEERLVREVAEAAMPDSKVRDSNGNLEYVYHGTDSDFWTFDTNVRGGEHGKAEGFGIYLSTSQEVTQPYGERQLRMFANITRPADSNKKTISKAELKSLIKQTCETEAKRLMEEEGYGSIKEALRDTWISNYVDTYSASSIDAAYNEVVQSILRMNDNDMDIVQEVMAGMAIRDYDTAMRFYHEMLTPATGIDGFKTQWTNHETGEKYDIYLAFDSSQLKSADPITYNADGNVIPLSERFNPNEQDIRYSQRELDDAAKDAGYSTKVYHGGADVTVFDTSRGTNGDTQYGPGTYVTNGYGLAEDWAVERDGKVTPLYLKDGVYFEGDNARERTAENDHNTPQWKKLEKILKDEYGLTDEDIRIGEMWGFDSLAKRMDPDAKGFFVNGDKLNDALRRAGYAGVHGTFYDMEQWCVFDPSSLKSADPITYDNDGNAIPLSQRFNTEEQDIRLQQRTEAITDRELLQMSAEEMLAADNLTEGEREAVSIMNDRLTALQDLQRQRIELGQKYREQQFGKGGDRKAAAQTLERMKILDAKIERAENSVLEVENTNVLKRVLKQARRNLEAIDREKAVEMVQRYRDRRNNAEAVRKYRDRINKDASDITNWIIKPNGKDAMKNVPAVIREPIVKILQSIDRSSKRSLRGGPPTKADLAYLEQMRKLQAVMSTRTNTDSLYTGYTDLPPNFMENLDKIITSTEDLAKKFDRQFVLNQMTADELKTMSEFVTMLKNYIHKASSTLSLVGNVSDLGDSSIEDMSAMRPLNARGPERFLMWQTMRPIAVFDRFGRGGQKIFKSLMKGQSQLAFDTKEMIKFAEDAYTAQEAKKWTKELITVKLGGEDVQMPISYAMGLYELSKRKNAEGHLYGNGVRVATFKHGTKKIADQGHKVTRQEIANLAKQLNDIDPRIIEVADKLQNYMAEKGAEWGNFVSVARFGIEQFTEPDYYPIASDGRFLPATADEKPSLASLYALLNMSFTKELNENANNRAMVYDIFDVFANHMSSMAQYHSFALPVLDSLKWLNYEQFEEVPDTYKDGRPKLNEDGTPKMKKGDVTGSVKEQMARAFGGDVENAKSGASYAQAFVTNILKAINGTSVQGDGFDTIGMKGLHAFNVSRIAYNVRVFMQQPLAITRAAMVMNPLSVTKAMAAVNKIPANIKEMQEKNGIAAWKSLGFYDVNVSRAMTDLIKHDDTALQKINEFGLLGAEVADKVTWAVMWQAAKYEAQRKGIKESDAGYWDAVNDIFDETIYRTQVVDSVLTKNEYLRSKNFFARATGSFMNEPMTTYSMLASAYDKFRMDRAKGMSMSEAWKKNGKNIGRTAAVYAVSAILLAAVQGVADAWRDDDEYETFGEKMWEAFTGNVIDELTPFNNLPLFNEAWNFGKKMASLFGVDTYGSMPRSIWLEFGQELYDGTKRLMDKINTPDETNYTWYGAIYKLLGAASGITGAPLSTTTREAVSAWNNTVAHFAPSLKIKDYDPGPKNEIKYAFADGYLTREEAMSELTNPEVMGDDVMDENDAYWLLNGWEDGESTSKYSRMYTALLENPDDFNGALQELTDHGVKKKDAISQAKTQIGKWYRGDDETTITRDQAKKMLVKQVGLKEDAAEELLDEWTMKKDTGIAYGDEMKEAYLSGEMSYNDAVEYRIKYGGEDESSADAAVKKWKYEMETGIAYGDMKEAYMNGEITYAEAVRDRVKYGGVSEETATETVDGWKGEKASGVVYDDIDDRYNKGKMTRAQAIEAYMAYGVEREEAEHKVELLDFIKQYPAAKDFKYSTMAAYKEYCQADGVPVETFGQVWTYQSKTKADVDANGNSINGSRREKVLAYIDSLNISNHDKDSLYFACGYAQSTLKNAPWH